MKYLISSVLLFAVLALGACEGKQGKTGNQGNTGSPGATGEQGDTGNQGNTGAFREGLYKPRAGRRKADACCSIAGHSASLNDRRIALQWTSCPGSGPKHGLPRSTVSGEA